MTVLITTDGYWTHVYYDEYEYIFFSSEISKVYWRGYTSNAIKNKLPAWGERLTREYDYSGMDFQKELLKIRLREAL